LPAARKPPACELFRAGRDAGDPKGSFPTDRLWSIEDIVALVDAAGPSLVGVAPTKRRLRRVITGRLLLLLGLGFLIIVVLAHVAEAFRIFPAMGWGLPNSAGHYLDLVSAILGCALVSIGFLAIVLAQRKNSN
jgi:hypothetical protein